MDVFRTDRIRNVPLLGHARGAGKQVIEVWLIYQVLQAAWGK